MVAPGATSGHVLGGQEFQRGFRNASARARVAAASPGLPSPR
jgi:hypothetical protein